MSQSNARAAQAARQRISPPWPLTTPLVDVYLLFLALPILWVLGLEQVVPVTLILLASIKMVLTQFRVHVPLTAIIAFLFLGWQLLSMTSIDVASNRIVFTKNYVSYLAGFILYLLIANQVRTTKQFRRMLGALLLFSALATIIGMLFILGLLPDRFTALGAPLVPSILRGSTFVQENIIVREVGRPNAVLGGLTYRRVSSIFLYPTTMAVAYLILLPMQFYALRTARGQRRLWLLLLFACSMVVFLFTATRTAFIVLPAAVAALLIWRWRLWRRIPRLALPVLVILLLLLLLAVLLPSIDSLLVLTDDLFVRTRAESFLGRMEVYQATLESLGNHWLSGWGTPRQIPQVQLAPAGTHGEFINVLYSFGLVGFLLYGALHVSIWLDLLTGLRSATPTYRLFLSHVFVILLALNLNGLAHGINFDLLTLLLSWAVIGLAHVAPRLDRVTEERSVTVSTANRPGVA